MSGCCCSPESLYTGSPIHSCLITAQIYLNERVPPEWRARSQALMWLMSGGVGNLVGYLGSGFWLRASTRGDVTDWTRFWGGLAAVMMLVLGYFVIAYHAQGGGLRRKGPAAEAAQS